MSVKIDLSRDELFDSLGLTRLRESYMLPTENSPQERFAFVSERFSSNPEHAQRLYEYSSKHWLSYSTPILSYGNNPRALPISCFLSFLEDSSDGLVDTYAEVSRLSMAGGGVGIHVRSRGTDEKSVGVMPHLKTYDAGSLAYKQNTRRGSYAAFLDIDHPDIIKFIQMRKATGDQNQKAMNLNHGVNITNKFMQIIENCMLNANFDDSWDLIQPNSGKVVQTVSAKQIWQDLLEIRMQTGEPYLIFIDTANAALRDYQKAAGLKIHGSNLCLTGDTLVSIKRTKDSEPEEIPLEQLVAQYTLGLLPEVQVFSYNGISNVWSAISAAALTAEVDELYEITSPSGNTIRCTGNHKIYTQRGYVEAKDLLETDKLLES